MICDCPENWDTTPGEAYSRLDHDKHLVEGYAVCPCGKREKLIFTLDYRPKPKEYVRDGEGI